MSIRKHQACAMRSRIKLRVAGRSSICLVICSCSQHAISQSHSLQVLRLILADAIQYLADPNIDFWPIPVWEKRRLSFIHEAKGTVSYYSCPVSHRAIHYRYPRVSTQVGPFPLVLLLRKAFTLSRAKDLL